MTTQEIFNIIVTNADIQQAATLLYPGITRDDYSIRCDDGVNFYVDLWNDSFGTKPTQEELIAKAPIVYAQMKREEINLGRNHEESLGFTYLGKVFDSDDLALKRIGIAVHSAHAAITNGTPEAFIVNWTTQDNSVMVLDAFQMVGMPVAMAEYGMILHHHANSLKAQVETIKTQFLNNEVDTITALTQMQTIVWTKP